MPSVPGSVARASLALALLTALTGCDASGADDLEGQRVEADGVAFHVPDDYVEVDEDQRGGLVVAFDAPTDERSARVGVTTTDALDPALYLTDVAGVGAVFEELEPEVARDESVDVAGAVDAHLVQWSYAGPEDVGAPRIRVLQIAAVGEDETLYDVRYEALEEAYDEDVADLLADSLALTD